MSDTYRHTPRWIDKALRAYDRAVREQARITAARIAEEQ